MLDFDYRDDNNEKIAFIHICDYIVLLGDCIHGAGCSK